MIKVKYISIDSSGRGQWKTFKTLKGARKFAQYWVGKHPELGSTYAVSGDGVGKIVAEGVALKDLFGDDIKQDNEPDPLEEHERKLAAEDRARIVEGADTLRSLWSPYRSTGCTCSDQQLNHVGCDCAAGRP